MTKQTSDSHSMTKLKVATTLAVLTLHIGAALALVKMDVPRQIKLPEEPAPIEIKLVMPLEESSERAIEPEPKSEPEPPAMPAPQKSEPKSEPEPKPEANPKKTEPKQSKLDKAEPKKTEPQKTKTDKTESDDDSIVQENKIEKNQQVIASEELDKRLKWEAEQQRLRQEQADREAREAKERAEHEARQKAALEKAAAEKAAKEKAEREAQEAKDRAEQAAKEEAARRAKEDAERKAALEAEASSNTPQKLLASKASWRIKPKFQFPENVLRSSKSGDVFSLSLRLTVDKQGNVTNVDIASSSGNSLIDRAAKNSVRRAKFHPFKNDNGQPIMGDVVIPFDYIVP